MNWYCRWFFTGLTFRTDLNRKVCHLSVIISVSSLYGFSFQFSIENHRCFAHAPMTHAVVFFVTSPLTHLPIAPVYTILLSYYDLCLKAWYLRTNVYSFSINFRNLTLVQYTILLYLIHVFKWARTFEKFHSVEIILFSFCIILFCVWVQNFSPYIPWMLLFQNLILCCKSALIYMKQPRAKSCMCLPPFWACMVIYQWNIKYVSLNVEIKIQKQSELTECSHWEVVEIR